MNPSTLSQTVREIFLNVAENGDTALRNYTRAFDNAEFLPGPISQDKIESAQVPDDFDGLIRRTIDRLKLYHEATELKETKLSRVDGCSVERRIVPIKSVGLYVPGGRNPLVSSLLMQAVPAKMAGVGKIQVCTPANSDGNISPLILRAAEMIKGLDIYPIGGAQAIAGLAIGTQSMPQVQKIFGPGNAYVTEAKRQAREYPWNREIDLLAGPSELVIILESSQRLFDVFVEALTQVEHGPGAWTRILATENYSQRKLDSKLDRVSRTLNVSSAARSAIGIEFFPNRGAITDRVRELSPEHLTLFVKDPSAWDEAISSSGASFMGPKSSVVLGDYGLGSNHTLPTGGFASRQSGLSVKDFQRCATLNTNEGIGFEALEDVSRLAELEGLKLHRLAAERLLRKQRRFL